MLSCFGKCCAIPDDFMVHRPETPTQQICLICDIALTDKFVTCRSCQSTIGHVHCLNQWLMRRDCCPNCKRTLSTKK